MKIAIRVDASIQIGTGHVMRCLTLAEELSTKDAHIIFVCREHDGNFCDHIESKGNKLYRLPLPDARRQNGSPDANQIESSPPHASWLGVSWQEDADETISALLNEGIDCLVVDHFGIDAKWESKVKEALSAKIMVIDGLADRIHDCDILLDQTFSQEGSRRWKQLVPPSCKLFVGPQYALLRSEFYKARQLPRPRDGTIRRILIAFGGVDPDNATNTVLEALTKLNREDIALDVVVGKGNPFHSMLKKKCSAMPNATLSIQPQPIDIAKKMVAADFAIGAAGTMMWERCCVGLPSLLVVIADNQSKVSEYLDSISAACFAGFLGAAGIQGKIMEKMDFFLNNAQAVKEIGKKAFNLMDGCGSKQGEYIFKEMIQ